MFSLKNKIFKILGLYFLLSSNLFANECLSENDISINIHNYTTREGETLSELKILNKKTNEILFSEELLGSKDLDKDVKFIDMDFDGNKEIIITSDEDPNHTANYIAVKVNCNQVSRYSMFGEVGEFKGYDISYDEKRTYIYLDENHNITTRIYCYSDKLYLCQESFFIENGVELIKKYDKKERVIMAEVYSNKNRLEAIINEKSYLNKEPNLPTNMYLIKGDKVIILDKKIDSSGQKWYFINYKGKKDINMWIKAEAVDLK
ncbi:hypothetical protein [Actinobacillus capsulatus]|uniref:hypothetical protein n=1 Tax=Actinobacillus capsulatus TaxID=717 RepID=UPI000379D788|nr:hypothetical protein [Actinobacillus capsulatus]